jgi:secreted PhoX family phosphatase
LTCRYKCGNACFHDVPNESENAYFGDVVEGVIGRRSVLKGGLSAIVLAGVGVGSAAALAGATASRATAQAGDTGTGLTFTPIPSTSAEVDDLIVPEGYASLVVVRWGDPILPGAPRFDKGAQTPEGQRGQFGYNCDYVGFFPMDRDGSLLAQSRRGILAVNHEYTIEPLMFDGYPVSLDEQPDFVPTRDQVDIGLAAHGMSFVEVQRSRGATGGFFYLPDSPFNRRLTAETPMELTGPAAGDDLLKTSADPTGRRVLGTLNNCAGGKTPWGTVLTAEENFNQYFGRSGPVPDAATREAHDRYGLAVGDGDDDDGERSERQWEAYYDRFDMSQEPNEPYRFGWIVEIDPYDPSFVPRKRTALGRFKHEGAATVVARDGRVVSYMGDDERFDYAYKFVSSGTFDPSDRAANFGLLDDGDLYVARFDGDSSQAELDRYNDPATLGQKPDDGQFDGTGVWIPLVQGGESMVPGFTVAEVLVKTRLAADAVGATKMDRPEDFGVSPVTGRVYMAMTNNTRRTPDSDEGPVEANPRLVDETGAPEGNKYGHIVEVTETGDDAAATTFFWRLLVVCGDPSDPTTFFQGVDPALVSPISSPDNLTFDSLGNLWVATDGQQGSLGKADAIHAVPLTGPQTGRVMQFLSVPAGAEAQGPQFTPDDASIFVAVQHPGDGYESEWPDRQGFPRPSVASVFKPSGGRIGS